jgi:hypothetical protein
MGDEPGWLRSKIGPFDGWLHGGFPTAAFKGNRNLRVSTSVSRSRRGSKESGSRASALLMICWATCSAEFISVCTNRDALKDTIVPSAARLAIRTIAIRQIRRNRRDVVLGEGDERQNHRPILPLRKLTPKRRAHGVGPRRPAQRPWLAERRPARAQTVEGGGGCGICMRPWQTIAEPAVLAGGGWHKRQDKFKLGQSFAYRKILPRQE